MSPETEAAEALLHECSEPMMAPFTRAMEAVLFARAVIALERIAAALEHGRDAAEARDD
jgi:hypothetical protein